jgi:hypothetical protein
MISLALFPVSQDIPNHRHYDSNHHACDLFVAKSGDSTNPKHIGSQR